MPFGVVSGVDRGMGVLDGSGDRRKRRGNLEGKYGASHCNQWGLCGVILCRERWRRSCFQITFRIDFLFIFYEIKVILLSLNAI